jgi:hypothetical protein
MGAGNGGGEPRSTSAGVAGDGSDIRANAWSVVSVDPPRAAATVAFVSVDGGLSVEEGRLAAAGRFAGAALLASLAGLLPLAPPAPLAAFAPRLSAPAPAFRARPPPLRFWVLRAPTGRFLLRDALIPVPGQARPYKRRREPVNS